MSPDRPATYGFTAYREMLRIRLVEERIADLYADQEMRCPVHLCIGQEAVAVGVCAELGLDDYVFSAHRSHGHYLAKGGDLNAMIAELYGKATGACGGKGGSMHLLDRSVGFLGATPILGSTIPIAVGAAMGTAMKGESRVTVVFLGEAATEEGVFHESVNFASLKGLPVVFVCENNQYSVYSPLRVRQPEGRVLADLVAGHGIPSFSGDGNNLADVGRLAHGAVALARSGGGPSFLEFHTYRWRDHVGPDFDHGLGYRTKGELDSWMKRDPVAAFERSLLADDPASGAEIQAIRSELAEEIEAAVRFAKESPFPDSAAMSEHVFA